MAVPLYITPLLTAIAWSWLGSPRGGLINLFGRQVLGIDSLVNLHTPAGVIFVAALSYVPLPFLLVGAALRGMDPVAGRERAGARRLHASPRFGW